MSLFCIAAGDKFVPVTIAENDLFSGITKVLKVLRPTWPLDNVKFKVRREDKVTETNYMQLCGRLLIVYIWCSFIYFL